MRGEPRGEGKINSRYRFVVSSSICTVASCCARAPQTDSQTTLFRNYQRFYHSIRKILDFSDSQLIINDASTNGAGRYENNSNADAITVPLLVHARYVAFMLSRDLRNEEISLIMRVSYWRRSEKTKTFNPMGGQRMFYYVFDFRRLAPYEATEHGNLSRSNWEFKQIMTL